MGKPAKDVKLAADRISDLAQQVQNTIFANPITAPQAENLLQAQENVLQEFETFSHHWFARRHTATKTALQAAQDIARNGGRDPSVMVKKMSDWQQHSMERIVEDFQEWLDLCARCAGHVASAEVETNQEILEESAKGGTKAARSKHTTPV
ncbi:hypothetical protein [Roseovarius sp.]|uniref:hypothetical protein n=1 Tax=Roseovarius sp. TaxID=1486281 RepID=UPI001E05D309|nr:hypothetical protein [Roseovarius sp.]TNE37494.1 MAG: hypothetical protein EP345_19395 [Sphingomonadales bacterium]